MENAPRIGFSHLFLKSAVDKNNAIAVFDINDINN